ncbi:hypothetical protein BM221_008095 [Beauveria bassiana]|uniref:Uncharacterized protein n=1 Tax=Beauveria bassiana TaxID=176275 RepID=A0A2N6NF27_BEABA|nr:hypothetical protein BM221_008095 [Beauveria bassiana]
MPIRNPFARRPEVVIPFTDENERTGQENNHPGFERVDTVGSKASSAMSIRSSKSHDVGEYKMSDTRSSSGEIEPFSISRESFDSYRRSFVCNALTGVAAVGAPKVLKLILSQDITARSPIKHNEAPVRQSLDSARFPRQQRSVHRKIERQPATLEENFEDIGLDDGKQQPRKRGFFAKLTDGQDKDSSPSSIPRFLMGGRKRGHSGQGAELGIVDHVRKPATSEER